MPRHKNFQRGSGVPQVNINIYLEPRYGNNPLVKLKRQLPFSDIQVIMCSSSSNESLNMVYIYDYNECAEERREK